MILFSILISTLFTIYLSESPPAVPGAPAAPGPPVVPKGPDGKPEKGPDGKVVTPTGPDGKPEGNKDPEGNPTPPDTGKSLLSLGIILYLVLKNLFSFYKPYELLHVSAKKIVNF